MRKYFILLFGLLSWKISFSQIYYSNYLDTTSEWRIIQHNADATEHEFFFRTLFFDGLENINGYTYYKMYQTYFSITYNIDYTFVITPQTSPNTQFIGYLREDINGTFYLFNNGPQAFYFNEQIFPTGTETVYFDNQAVLNAQLGDPYFSNCNVENIDTYTISTANYKKISAATGSIPTKGSALEGVGTLLNFCSPQGNLDLTLINYNRIHCYTKQGQTYNFFPNYYLPDFTLVECSFFANANRQNLNTVSVTAADFKIYPNPAKTGVQVTSDTKNIASIALFDMQGRIYKTITVNSLQAFLDLTELQSGNYILSLTTENSTWNYKLIIE